MAKLLFFALIAYTAFVLFLYFNQRKLIYFPSSFSPSPADFGVPGMQIVSLQTEDGLELKAWYQASALSQLPTILYLHGNAGHLGHRSALIAPFLTKGYGVLLVAYRGYSGNPGKPSEEGLYQDARAALQFLKNQHIADRCLVLYGESLGTAVDIQLAAEHPVGGLILQSPFTSLGDVAQVHYPFFPVKWLLKDQFNLIEKIPLIQAPTLVIYGEKDVLIPPTLSISVFKALKATKTQEPVQLKGHNDLFDSDLAVKFIRAHVDC